MSKAYTRVSDVIVPEVFNPYFIERTAALSALIQSGIVVPDPKLNKLASSGGRTLNMPFFSDLTGNSEIIPGASSSSSLSVKKIGTGQDIACLFMRAGAWGVNDLSTALSGADPMKAIGDLVADWWNRDEQATLINILTGVFLDNNDKDSGDLIHDIHRGNTTLASAANKISGEAITDAQFKLGDSAKKLTGIMMHSTPYSTLVKQKLIDYVFDETVKIHIPYYMEKRVIVDDTCPTASAGTTGLLYNTFLFGQGAVGRGEGNAPVPTETDRDSLAGEDILISRRHFLLHPRGVKWTDNSCSDQSPTNAEAALATNWDRVYEKKNIRIVKLVTNG